MTSKPSDAEMAEACERAAISHNSLAETRGRWADAEKDDAALRARYLAVQKREEWLAQCFSAAAERIRAMGVAERVAHNAALEQAAKCLRDRSARGLSGLGDVDAILALATKEPTPNRRA